VNKIFKIAISLIFISSTISLFAQEPQVQKQLKETLKMRQQMREIEKNIIENDSELKAIAEELKNTSTRLRERLNAKLAGHTEYQELKKKTEKMKEDWRKERPERRKRRPGERPPMK
jgi:chromosome segregation ATPase